MSVLQNFSISDANLAAGKSLRDAHIYLWLWEINNLSGHLEPIMSVIKVV